MAIAVAPSTYEQQEKERKGYLDISAKDFYFNQVRPHMEEMTLKCRTDKELLKTIDKVINATDSFIIREDWANVAESFEILQIGITDANYFNGVMKKAPEAEREMVRTLISKIGDLQMLIKCEKGEPIKDESKLKERLNYHKAENSPIGENEDFAIHNMAKLNEPKPKERIPNV